VDDPTAIVIIVVCLAGVIVAVRVERARVAYLAWRKAVASIPGFRGLAWAAIRVATKAAVIGLLIFAIVVGLGRYR
jgi:hypothetical protein